MEEVLEFSFVYSKDAVKIKGFIDAIPRNIECINYIDIYNKLAKNDYFQSEPSDAVVSSYLMRQLQTILSRSTTRNLYYVLGSPERDVICGVQSYVKTLTDRDIIFKIYHTPEVSLNGMRKLFDEAVQFEIDY
jgi:hypothetical protein